MALENASSFHQYLMYKDIRKSKSSPEQKWGPSIFLKPGAQMALEISWFILSPDIHFEIKY